MDTIWELTFQLLSSISVQCNPVRERGLSGLTVNDIDMIQRIIQAELDRATDATCLRFESLCLTVIPGLLHLLGLLQNVPSDRLLLVVVVSESWLVLGLLLFFLLLPCSILDPLLQDYVEGQIRQSMTGNLLDMLFVLNYQSSVLNGDLGESGSIAAEMKSLYATVVKKNEKVAQELQRSQFVRESANSFDQLYSTLYSFGVSIISLSRLHSIQYRSINHLLLCIHNGSLVCKNETVSVLERIPEVITTIFRRLQTSPFVASTAEVTIPELNDDMALLTKEEAILQSNIQSFKQSLQRSYSGYRDIILPIQGAVSQLQHGLQELITVSNAVSSQINLSLGNLSTHYRFLQAFTQFPFRVISMDYHTLGGEMTALMNLDVLKNARSKSLVFRSLLTQLLLFNVTVLRRTTADSAITDFISSFTDLFNAQKEAEAKKVSLIS